jgi:hypothetical protein
MFFFLNIYIYVHILNFIHTIVYIYIFFNVNKKKITHTYKELPQ